MELIRPLQVDSAAVPVALFPVGCPVNPCHSWFVGGRLLWVMIGASSNSNMLPPKGFRLMLSGSELARGYQIEGSADLQVWQPVGWVTNTFGTAQFLDAAPGTSRAYRAAY